MAVKLLMSVVVRAVVLVAAASGAFANDFIPKKPSWLSEMSVTLKESYDDNVFLSGVNKPPAYILPRGSAAALANESSWITTVTPRLAVDAAPAVKWSPLKSASLSYAPEFVTFHDVESESHTAHAIGSTLRAGNDEFSLGIDNSATFVDGDEQGPVYPGSLMSAYATCATRDRRKQWQERGAMMLRYNRGKVFVRPVASLLYLDYQSDLLNSPGYQNYPDRYDVNGGSDLGWNITQKFAATVGYRYGHQHQDRLAFSPYASSGDYQRALVGAEGTPWKWLELKLQIGPEFRSYPDNTARRITPVDDLTFTTYFADGAATATITTNDSVSVRYRRFLWLSSIGKVPYYDSTYELSYRRKLTEKLTATATGRFLNADYSVGNLLTCKRDDWMYIASLSGSYSINAHASIALAYSLELGRNAQDEIARPVNREFDRNVISLSTTVKF